MQQFGHGAGYAGNSDIGAAQMDYCFWDVYYLGR